MRTREWTAVRLVERLDGEADTAQLEHVVTPPRAGMIDRSATPSPALTRF